MSTITAFDSISLDGVMQVCRVSSPWKSSNGTPEATHPNATNLCGSRRRRKAG